MKIIQSQNKEKIRLFTSLKTYIRTNIMTTLLKHVEEASDNDEHELGTLVRGSVCLFRVSFFNMLYNYLFLLVLNFVKAAVLMDQNAAQTLSLEFDANSEDKLCDRNDIYILDGERTLVITSRKLDQKDLEHESLDEEALAQKVDNQDMIIELLKQKLDETERKLVKSNEAFVIKESEHAKLLEVTKVQEDKIAQLEKVVNECQAEKASIESMKDAYGLETVQCKNDLSRMNNSFAQDYVQVNDCLRDDIKIKEQNKTIISMKDQITNQVRTFTHFIAYE